MSAVSYVHSVAPVVASSAYATPPAAAYTRPALTMGATERPTPSLAHASVGWSAAAGPSSARLRVVRDVPCPSMGQSASEGCWARAASASSASAAVVRSMLAVMRRGGGVPAAEKRARRSLAVRGRKTRERSHQASSHH